MKEYTNATPETDRILVSYPPESLALVYMAKCVKLEQARNWAEYQLECLLSDEQAENQWPHLPACNFTMKRIGEQKCNCPLGKRIYKLNQTISQIEEENRNDYGPPDSDHIATIIDKSKS